MMKPTLIGVKIDENSGAKTQKSSEMGPLVVERAETLSMSCGIDFFWLMRDVITYTRQETIPNHKLQVDPPTYGRCRK